MKRKDISFIEGLLLLISIFLLQFLLKSVFVNSIFANPLVTILSYVPIIWFVKFRYNGFPKIKSVRNPPTIGMFLFLFSLFLFITFLLELEALLRLGLQEYLYSFNNERGLNTNFITILLISPFLEEIFFRRIIFQGFKFKYGLYRAIIFSSLLFAMVHIEIESINVITKIISAFLLSLLLCYTLFYTGNIKFSIIMHFMWNLLNYIVAISIVIFDIYLNNYWHFIVYSTILVMVSAGLAVLGWKKLKGHYGWI